MAAMLATLSEPPAFQLGADSVEARLMAAGIEAQLRVPGDEASWLRCFAHIVGRSGSALDQLPPQLRTGVRATN